MGYYRAKQVLHDKTITKEKKIDALLVTAKSISYELSLLHIASKENNISAVKLILGYYIAVRNLSWSGIGMEWRNSTILCSSVRK